MIPPTNAYVGWLKDGRHPWQPVCTGDTSAACYASLLRIPAEGQFVQRLVLPSGKRPGGVKDQGPAQRQLF